MAGADPPAANAPALDRIEAAVTQAVTHVLATTERSLARRIGARAAAVLRSALRTSLYALLIVYFAFGALFLTTRYWVMPRIDDYRPWLEQQASRMLGKRVGIGRIDTAWRGIHPHLRLIDVRLLNDAGASTLRLPHVEATLSWTSALALEPRFESLHVLAPEIDIRRLPGSRFAIAGFIFDPAAASADNRLLDWALLQGRISVRDARIHYVDASTEAAATMQSASEDGPSLTPSAMTPSAMHAIELTDVELEFQRGVLQHRAAFRARPPADLAAPFDVRLQFHTPRFGRAADYARWSGRLFAQTDYADVARVARALRLPLARLNDGLDLQQALGALRLWIEFDRLRLDRITADLALQDVHLRLARDLEPLRLASVQGRMTHKVTFEASALPGRDQERVRREHLLALSNLSLYGEDGWMLTPTDLQLRVPAAALSGDAPSSDAPRATPSEFNATHLDLDALSRLAVHVPLAPQLRTAIARLAARGRLSDLHVQWQGESKAPTHYRLRTRFAGVGTNPHPPAPDSIDPVLPGFDNLAGSLEIDERGGRAQLDSRDGALLMPDMLAAPRIAFAQLAAQLSWTLQPELAVHIDAARLLNDDLDLSVSGTLHDGAHGPIVDLSGRVPKLALNAAHRYLPVHMEPAARAWVRRGFLAGDALEGSFKVRGALADFPFPRPGDDAFHFAARIRGGTLDYLPADAASELHGKGWPVISGIEGTLVLDRASIEVHARQGQVLSTHLSNVSARIADTTAAEPRLRIQGNARGPLADGLAFVNATPLAGWTGGVLAEASAIGEAQLDLALDIPLASGRQPQVQGAIALANNDFTLRRSVPPLARAQGRIDFNEHGVRVASVKAAFLGGETQLDAQPRADGALVVHAAGSATPPGVRSLFTAPLLLRLLDTAQGSAQYTGRLVARKSQPAEISFETDLVGWSVDLPAPLAKRAPEAWPTRVRIEPILAAAAAGSAKASSSKGSTSGGDRIIATAAPWIALRLERSAPLADHTRTIERGIVRIGGIGAADSTAPSKTTSSDNSALEVLPDDGLRAVLTLPRLDVDQWQAWLNAHDTAGKRSALGAAEELPNLIAARVRELVIAGKPMANVVLGATRRSEGGTHVWLANVVSDNVTGSLSWRMPRTEADAGHVSARLTRLAIPERSRTEVAAVLDTTNQVPSFDVVADNFELGPRPLGRLELVANNVADAGGGTWELQRLEIANPDARMSAVGRWAREPGSKQRKMELDFRVTMSNAGNLLGRYGIRDALKGGDGELSGSVHWLGSPLAVDYATLGGSLQLALEHGQFMRADAGAGRLLGVLSLQSLPRRMSLDFRDVFSDGFAFDKVGATADIVQGRLTTHNFRMRSANATVLLEGSTDLHAETQQLHVVVLPEINASSASLVYALLANPAVGVATFLAQLVLRDPLSKAFSFEYDITGTWSDPQVKRRDKRAPETGDQTGGASGQ